MFHETNTQIAHAKSELDKLERKAVKMGLNAQVYLVFDIDQHIKHHKHDFIVMGSHGTNGFKEMIGSNTQKAVRNSPVPVLVVKKKSKKFEIKNIVLASTFQEDVHKPFHKIIEFADLMKAQIHLLNVNMPFHFKETDEAGSDMQAFVKKMYERHMYH